MSEGPATGAIDRRRLRDRRLRLMVTGLCGPQRFLRKLRSIQRVF
jgi:hypothetical protein